MEKVQELIQSSWDKVLKDLFPKNKTAMQQLIEELIEQLEKGKKTLSSDEKYLFQYVINKAEYKLEKEKEQIIDAHVEGFYSPPFRKSRYGEAEEYYNEMYQ